MSLSPPTAAASSRDLLRGAGLATATSLVIANVIGGGIFTTPGFLARDLGSPAAVLGIWVLGAILALAGALSYSELGAMYPQAGGEYIYLREAYGPLVAFVNGWMCFFSSFSAPIAAACIGVAAYLSPFMPGFRPDYILASISLGGWRWTISGAQTGPQGALPPGALHSLPVSLIFVLYCYSGWNAAAYIAGELREPNRTIPRSLLTGTAIVTALYIGLNVLFLYALPISEMSGVLQIGEKAASALFGSVASSVISVIMALSIFASASAMIMAGPRVYYAMASDGLFPERVAHLHKRYASPAWSITLQSLWASVLLLSGTFEQLIVYSGFVLVLFSALAVGAVLVLRLQHPELPRAFLVPGYPITPLLYVGFSAWILYFTLTSRPTESLWGVVTALAGLPFYFFWRRANR